MLQSETSPEETKTNLQLMQKNAKQLNKLINQLLDYRKLESGNLKLELSKGDIVAFVRNIVHSFADYALEKEIKLKFNAVNDDL